MLDKNFIKISDKLLATKKLKDGEKLLLAYINSYSINGQKIKQRNETLCENLGVELRKLQRSLSTLKKNGLITVTQHAIVNKENKSFNGMLRIIESNFDNIEIFLNDYEIINNEETNLTDRLKSTYESMFRTKIENDKYDIFYEDKINAIERYIALLDDKKLNDYEINQIEVEFESGNYSIIYEY